MAGELRRLDAYGHLIVLHTYPSQQSKVYGPLLGNKDGIGGLSLQNQWNATHEQTRKWVLASQAAKHPWVCSNDEQGAANAGVPADPGYAGKDGQAPKQKGGKDGSYDLHDIRRATLWGNLMAGGGGVMYYFGYQLPENDLLCEDWRSRDRSWDYCGIAQQFFDAHHVPFAKMNPADQLVGNPDGKQNQYCLAQEGKHYLVYFHKVSAKKKLDLSDTTGFFTVHWFDPRNGGDLQEGSVTRVEGGGETDLGQAPGEPNEDWAVVVRKESSTPRG